MGKSTARLARKRAVFRGKRLAATDARHRANVRANRRTATEGERGLGVVCASSKNSSFGIMPWCRATIVV